MSRILITGASGFVGSNAVDYFLGKGDHVVGIDNFNTGNKQFLKSALNDANFVLHEVDLLACDQIDKYFDNIDLVLHLSANADIRFGMDHPRRDLEQNVVVTHNLLEACRRRGIKKFAFSSTGSVYGEAKVVPTPEDAPFPIQTSLYGASKLAAEGLIQAYVETFNMQAWIFRFVSILGPRYTHGHIFDFYKQLKETPSTLKVLGNGHQNKSYLHVSDCIFAMDTALNLAQQKLNIFNLGTSESCEVRDSITWILDEMGLDPVVQYGTANKGWIGDNPLILLETSKIRSLGWKPIFSIQDGVRDTVRYFQNTPELFQK